MMETGETGMTEAPHGETEIVTMNEGVGIQDETNETGEKKGIIGETTVGGIVTVIATRIGGGMKSVRHITTPSVRQYRAYTPKHHVRR